MILNSPTDRCYLWLEETALEQDQSLPFELMNQLPQTHAEILVTVYSFVEKAPSPLIREALLKPPEDVNIGELALCEPCLRYYGETFSQHTKALRAINDDNDGLLYGRSRNVGRTIQELRGIELTGA